MEFIKRHRILFGVLSFIFMALPQAVDAIWSLAERIKVANIFMPDISIVQFTWITVPIGIIMLGIIIWQGRRRLQPIQQLSVKDMDEQ